MKHLYQHINECKESVAFIHSCSNNIHIQNSRACEKLLVQKKNKVKKTKGRRGDRKRGREGEGRREGRERRREERRGEEKERERKSSWANTRDEKTSFVLCLLVS